MVVLAGLSLIAEGQRSRVMHDAWYDDRPLHFGFTVGFNTMNFRITPSQEAFSSDSLFPNVAVLKPGINIQIVTNYKPNPFIDVRFLPGVSFGQRSIVYFKDSEVFNDQQRLESSFLEFPFIVKYKGARLNNVRPFIAGGLNYRYDLAGKREFDEEKPVYLRLKRSDLYYEAGVGLEIYLPYFKLTVEGKLSNGLRDVLVRDAAPGQAHFVNAIERMKSQIWVLSFHFE